MPLFSIKSCSPYLKVDWVTVLNNGPGAPGGPGSPFIPFAPAGPRMPSVPFYKNNIQ